MRRPEIAYSAAPRFTCAVVPDGTTVHVRPVGELDLATVPRTDAEIRRAIADGAEHLVIDLSGLTFLDSTGLHLVVEWDVRSRADGFTLSLIPGPAAVQRPFELTRLVDRLPFAA
jgi:anti-sigma B factor antagonist